MNLDTQLSTPVTLTPLPADPVEAASSGALAGGAAGLGLAGLHELLLRQRGSSEHAGVAAPVMGGALLGAVLMGLAANHKREQDLDNTIPPAASWRDVGDQITNNIYKNGFHKRAFDPSAAAETVGYFLPGVSTVLSARDAAKNVGSAFNNFSHGHVMRGFGDVLQGVGNVGLGVLGMIPLGGTVGRIGARLLGRGGQAALRAAKLRAVQQPGSVGQAWNAVSRPIGQGWDSAVGRVKTMMGKTPSPPPAPGATFRNMPFAGSIGRGLEWAARPMYAPAGTAAVPGTFRHMAGTAMVNAAGGMHGLTQGGLRFGAGATALMPVSIGGALLANGAPTAENVEQYAPRTAANAYAGLRSMYEPRRAYTGWNS